ncbi:hypothetical protein [Kineosporia succinea]|uniref:Basic secretory peptidase family protein n=1 Tax=Kineosporia succinea TaxID=84632 RepID=A0ABT9P757_9ACTN|nr:hypothetical protein [Kineosporia succinea]MDP9828239.1 hypothetical protein [Kineosporia succinea]
MRRSGIIAAAVVALALAVAVITLGRADPDRPTPRPGATTPATTTTSTIATEVTATSTRCRVTGPPSTRTLVEQLARLCVRAAGTVDDAWGNWGSTPTHLVVAGDTDELATLLDRDSTAGLADTAAVTVGADDAPADAVYINGPAFDGLSDLGREVVLTHELVHVATRATGDSDAPFWLEEGYADYVAYRDTGLSAHDIAGDALAAPLPTRLPRKPDFDAAGAGASVAYGRSWAAVTLLAERSGGVAELRTLYRTAAHDGTDEALGEAEFADVAAFVKAWRARITELKR